MTDTHLAFTWSVSRGRETYGYNIARLDDTATGKRYTCMGGGYDMTGTVFGEWLADVYQDRLLTIADRAHARIVDRRHVTTDGRDSLYGMRVTQDGSIFLDGACGLDSMQRIAEAIGLTVRTLWNRKGHTTGFIVSDVQEG